MEGWSTMFSPSQALERRNNCCLDLNLILNTFLKTTYAIYKPPYPANLANLNENIINLF